MIRKAKPKDYKQIANLLKETFETHNIFQKEEAEILAYIEHVEGTWIVAEEEEIVAGTCLVRVKKPNAEHRVGRIKHLAVGKDFQGRGIGKMLLEAGEGIIGEGKVEINVAGTEGNACPFYEKQGYEKEGELKDHYRKGETMVIMGKVLE